PAVSNTASSSGTPSRSARPRARSTETPLAPSCASAAARMGLPVLMDARSRPVGAKARTRSARMSAERPEIRVPRPGDAHGIQRFDGLFELPAHLLALAFGLDDELAGWLAQRAGVVGHRIAEPHLEPGEFGLCVAPRRQLGDR